MSKVTAEEFWKFIDSFEHGLIIEIGKTEITYHYKGEIVAMKNEFFDVAAYKHIFNYYINKGVIYE